jgi:hypothetical protein
VYNNITDVLPVETQMGPLLADNVQTGGYEPRSTGYEKAKAAASTLSGANRGSTGQIEASPGTEDINVEDIPF